MSRVICVLSIVLLVSSTGFAQQYSEGFASPLFGLATSPDGTILVAEFGAGVLQLDPRRGRTTLLLELPGVTDVAPLGRGSMFAVTGEAPEDPAGFPGAQKLYRLSRGGVRELADLYAFEMTHNPDGTDIVSNPFQIVALDGRSVLIADAGANDLLVADNQGGLDWVAAFPTELVSTANAKSLFGCPAGPPDICGLPDAIPAQPVTPSVAVGPDGAYYVGELKGFPAPTGMSRIWRVEPGTRHASCGESAACSVVLDGFTSVIDLAFGDDGTLYVLEFDESSWLAAELGVGTGGVLNACDVETGHCNTVASGLPLPTAVTPGKRGGLYVTILSLVPGQAAVLHLP